MSTHHINYSDRAIIERLYNAHLGQRCAILCNGESLNSFPYNFERYPFDTIGINRSWMFYNYSKYHFVLSLEQLKARTVAVESPRHFLDSLTTPPPECFFVGINRDKQDETTAKRELIKKINTLNSMLIDGWTQNDCATKGIGFAIDLENQTPWMPNTPYLALQFVRWMGYKHIDIWGLDLEGPKFWDKDWTMTEGHAKQQDEFFHHAAGVLVNDGVTVINRNPESKCTAFAKEQWR